MNKLKSIVLLLTTVTSLTACDSSAKLKHSPSVPEGYELSFFDEFDGNKLDETKWAYREDVKHYTIQKRENVEIKNGYLHLNLTPLATPEKKKNAAGAGIISHKRFKYGYYEVRSSMGDGIDDNHNGKVDEGWHHAFWAQAAVIDPETNTVATTFPGIRRTEIDIYENPTSHKKKHEHGDINNFTQHVIVWTDKGKTWGRLPTPPADLTIGKELDENFNATDWHTYAIEWTPEYVQFYVDGKKTSLAKYPASDEKFVHDNINVWLTAMGASWTGKVREKSLARYDYFRFYEKK